MKRDEERLHMAICRYLMYQYPNTYFMSDASGIRLPMGLAVKFKKMHSTDAQLDLVILEPKGGFSGLILEIKKSEDEIKLKNGGYRKNKHLQDQLKTKSLLQEKGYSVRFVWNLEMVKIILNNYMAL